MPAVSFTSWGSANSIGPSCHVFRFGEYRVAVDYGAGVRRGEEEARRNLERIKKLINE